MSATTSGAHTLDAVPGNRSISMAIPCVNPTCSHPPANPFFKRLLIASRASLGSGSGEGTAERAQPGTRHFWDECPRKPQIPRPARAAAF